MVIPPYIPIEFRGMSIITAIVFFFLGTGCTFVYQLFRREFKRVSLEVDRISKEADNKIKDTNEKVDLLFSKIDATNRDITEIKTHVARTLESVEWMKKYMERNAK